MAEGKGGGEGGEDLFEDLDKFFAPIQDVDWPETGEPATRGRPAEPEPEGEPEADEPTPEDTAAFEGPIRIESLEGDDEPVAGPIPGQEDLFEEGEAASVTEVEREDSDGGVTSFLFETEAEEELDEGAIGQEAFSRAPSAYVDLPGPEVDEGEAAVAELIEEGATESEEPPDLEAVEAAADHFAESVREEAGAGAGSTEVVTEEV